MLKKSILLASLPLLSSCYDYGFKETKVRGQVYLVHSEGMPEYALEFKESETNYRPYAEQQVKQLYDSGNEMYLVTKADANQEENYYKIDPETPQGAEELTQKEFEAALKNCNHCKRIPVPKA